MRMAFVGKLYGFRGNYRKFVRSNRSFPRNKIFQKQELIIRIKLLLLNNILGDRRSSRKCTGRNRSRNEVLYNRHIHNLKKPGFSQIITKKKVALKRS